LKENEEHFRTFDNNKSIFWLMVVQTTSYWLMKPYQQFNNNFYSYYYKLVWVPFLMNNWSKKNKLGRCDKLWKKCNVKVSIMHGG
jgi:hypothetical protein